MALLEFASNVIKWNSTLYECRDCGKKFSEETEECPVCGSDEIAYYEFE
jgi:rRNA maturation endonuclease Nob1